MEVVKDFYKETPFNFTENLDYYVDKIKNTNQILEYKDLHQLLRDRRSIIGAKKVNNIIEFGCGTGWFTNSISYYYEKEIKGIDFTEKALKTAKEVSSKLKLKNNFYFLFLFAQAFSQHLIHLNSS